ncbi:MAG: hypothetical protein EBZ48_01485 [Proteobacteria bacterium]|nr:hypothetical protein [Pseudomonadota bacterium]
MTHLAQIQIPALIALIALVLEGIAAFSPFAGLFQVVPILTSFAAVYFAWTGGYYFLALLYALGGVLACGAFFSVRLIANIPGMAIYLLILFLPRVNEGPQGDLFSMIEFPVYLLVASTALAILVVVLGVSFTKPRVFLGAVIGFAAVFAFTCSQMLSKFGWIPLQRLVSGCFGMGILVAGYLYYRTALAWRLYRGSSALPESQTALNQDPQVQEELQRLVMELEEFRKRNGYRLRWLQAVTRGAGIEPIFSELVRSGQLLTEAHGIANPTIGPRAPVKGPGLSADPAELLAVSRSANMEEVKESYQRIAAFFHHERVNKFGPESQKIARKMASEISKAYRALSKT